VGDETLYPPPPLAPADFASNLKAKIFTSGSDEAMVARLYAKVFHSAFSNRDPNFTLSYATLCWRNAHIPILARALLHADAAELNLSYNEILGEGAVALAAALAAGALPSLKKLDLRSTDICNGGIASLVALLDRGACPLLAEIVIDCTNCSKTQHQQLEEAGRRRTPPVIIKLAPRKGAAQIVRIGLPANSV